MHYANLEYYFTSTNIIKKVFFSLLHIFLEDANTIFCKKSCKKVENKNHLVVWSQLFFAKYVMIGMKESVIIIVLCRFQICGQSLVTRLRLLRSTTTNMHIAHKLSCLQKRSFLLYRT